MDNIVKILGARGSVPVSGPAYLRYGGATTCIFVKLAGQMLVLDAGSGLLNLPEEALSMPSLPLILTHLHLDHLLGLPMCPYLFRQEAHLTLYLQTHTSEWDSLLDKPFSPPFWPVRLSDLPAELSFCALPQRMMIGGILVETMPGVHPDGVTILRLTGGGKCIVFATDCTLTPELFSSLSVFARNCDLLLCDGQYSPEEWESRKTFGHSTWLDAAKLGAACHAKQVLIVHHDPAHTDAMLDSALPSLLSIYPQCAFAHEMEEISL